MTLSAPQLRRTLHVAAHCLCARDARAVLGALVASSRPAKHYTAEHYKALREPTIAKFRGRIQRQLRYAKTELLRNLEHDKHTTHAAALHSSDHALSAPADRPLVCSAAGSLMFDLHQLKTGLAAALRTASAEAVQTACNQLSDELDDPCEVPPAAVKRFLSNRANKCSGVADEIFAQVKRSMDEGFEGGETHAQLAQRIREEFGEIEEGRAETIAQTETSAAYGFSRHEGMKSVGIQYKKWLTSGLDNVRNTHKEANGQVVPIDEPFRVGVADLMYPGDENSDDPGEVINCHCVSIAVKGDEPDEEEEDGEE